MRAGLPTLVLVSLLVAAPLAAADHPGSNKGIRGLLPDLPASIEPGETNLVHRLPTVDAKFAAWEAAYPDFVERQTIGETGSGFPLYNVRVTDESVPFETPALSTHEKLRIYLDGGHHGNEYLGVELVMYYLEELLMKASGGDEATLAFLARTEIYATPMINVDGNFLDSRKNSALVDVNRNYDFHWGEDGASDLIADGTYRGPAAESESEVKANADFQRSIRPDMVITMHTGIAEFYWPWGWTHDVSPDDAFFVSLEKPFEDATNGRVDAMQGAELYIVSGASDDWAYGVLGAPGFTFEVHEDQNIPVYGQPIPEVISDQLGGLRFMIENVRHMGAWVEVRQSGATWTATNEGWAVAKNVTFTAGGRTHFVETIERDQSVELPFPADSLLSWRYNVLQINTTKTREHVLAIQDDHLSPASTSNVPGPGLALVVVALAAVVLLRRR